MTRRWLVVAALVLLPLAVYWPAVSHDYGFRDDYAHMREVHENPGWLTRLTASDGRPVYGVLLETSVASIRTVDELYVLRLLTTLLLSAVGLLLYVNLRRSGWSELEAATLGAAMTLLPWAQLLASWSITWPIAFGVLLAVAGFTLIDRGLDRKGWHRAGAVLAGSALYFVAGLTYQTSALFAVVPLAAVALMRQGEDVRDDMRWVALHIGILFLCLVSGWLLMNAIFATGVASAGERMQFESEPLLKLLWFVRNPLPNSMALFALRDDFATPVSFFVTLAAVATVIACGFLHVVRHAAQRWRWLFVALVLPFAAHSVSLTASSQAIGYRTMLPLSGVFLVLAAFGLRAMAVRFQVTEMVRFGVYGGILLTAAWLAGHNAFSLIAEPQGREWQLMQRAAAGLNTGSDRSVFIIRPRLENRSTERVYADEFGSRSSDAEWAAKEMFNRAVRERFPDGLPKGADYSIDTAFVPPTSPYDFVVDMNVLRDAGKASGIE